MAPYKQLVRQTAKNATKYDMSEYSKIDPNIFSGNIYPQSVKEMLLSMRKISREFKKFNNPYLLVQSGSDKLVDPFACFDLE